MLSFVFSAEEFGRRLWSVIEDRIPDIVENEATNNRACFVLLSLLEGGFPSVQPELVSALRRLRNPSTAGGKLLVKTLGTLAAGGSTDGPHPAGDTKAKAKAKKDNVAVEGAGDGKAKTKAKKQSAVVKDVQEEGTKKKKKKTGDKGAQKSS